MLTKAPTKFKTYTGFVDKESMKKLFLIVTTLLLTNIAFSEDKVYSFVLIPVAATNPNTFLSEATIIECPGESQISEQMQARVLNVPATVDGQKIDLSKISPEVQVDGRDYLITGMANRDSRDEDSSKLRFQMNDVKIKVSGKKVEFKIPIK